MKLVALFSDDTDRTFDLKKMRQKFVIDAAYIEEIAVSFAEEIGAELREIHAHGPRGRLLWKNGKWQTRLAEYRRAFGQS